MGVALFSTYTQVEGWLERRYSGSGTFGTGTGTSTGTGANTTYTNTTTMALIPVVAGALAGLVQTVVSAPIDTLKRNYDLADLVEGRYRSITDYVWKTGVQRLPTLLRDSYHRHHWASTAFRDTVGYGLIFGAFHWVRLSVSERIHHVRQQWRTASPRGTHDIADGNDNNDDNHNDNDSSSSIQPTRQDRWSRTIGTATGGVAAALVYQLWATSMEMATSSATATATATNATTTSTTAVPSYRKRLLRPLGRSMARSLLPMAGALCCYELMMGDPCDEGS